MREAMPRGALARSMSSLLVMLLVVAVGVSAAPVESAAAADSLDRSSSSPSARQSALQSSLRTLDFPFRFRGHLYTPALSKAEEAAQAAAEGPIPVSGTLAYLNFAEQASKHRVRSIRQTPQDMPALRGDAPPELEFRPIEGAWPSLALHRRKHFYEASISLGSARQPLRVVVDTALPKSWVIDSALDLPLQEHQPIASFASHASRTFAARVPEARDDDLPTPHFSSMFSGIVARDQAFLGPLAHPVLEFTLVTALVDRQDAEPGSQAAAATGLGVALPFLWEHSGVLGLGVKPLKGADRGVGAGTTPRVLNYWQRLGMNRAAVVALRAQAAKDAKSNVCGCGTAMLGRACWCSAEARKAAHEFLAKLANNPSLVNEPVIKPSMWRRRLLEHEETESESTTFLQLDDGADESPARPSKSDAWLGEPMTLDTLLRNEDLLRELGLEPAALGAMSDAEIDVIIDYAEAKRNEIAHAKVAPKTTVYENSTSSGEHRLNAMAKVAPTPVPHEHVVDHAAVPQHEKTIEALAAAAPAAAVKAAVVPPLAPRAAAPKTAPAAPAPAPTPIVTPKPAAAAPAAAAPAAVVSKPKPKGASPRSIRVKDSDVAVSAGAASAAPSLMEMAALASFYFAPPSASSTSSNADEDAAADGCFIPGHIDARFYTGGIHWMAADHTHASWSVGVADLLIDGVSTELCSKANTGGAGCVAALSTGSTQIRASERIMMPLLEALPVDPNCVGAALPRTLTIVLSNGIKVDLSEGDLRDRQRAEDDGMFVRSADDSCASVLALDTQRMTSSSVVSSASGAAPEVLVLGTPFLRKFYTVFDFEGARIGLARPRHDWFALNGCAWQGVGLSTPKLAADLAQASPKESWCVPIRSDQCPAGRNPFEHDAAAAESTDWAGTGAKVSAVSSATRTLALHSARFATKAKPESENPQLLLAKVLTGENFFHGRDAERQHEAQQRRARRTRDARIRRWEENRNGRRYRKPRNSLKKKRKTAATPLARAKATAMRDWTQPLRVPRVAAASRAHARRPAATSAVGAHIFPARATPLHPRHRVLPHVISSSAPAAVRATSALHEMVLSSEEKRLSAEAEKLLKAEALKHPVASGSGQAPAAMIPALTPANHRVGATPRSVLRAAGMDPRAMRTTPEGLPAALPRFVARDPFDLNGYGVDDILPQQGMESMARSAVDETIGEALQSIRQMEATMPSAAQLTAQQQQSIGSLADVVAAAEERVDNTEQDRAVREAESKAMQGLLQRAGDQALLESPAVAAPAPAPASSAAARLQQVKQIMRNMQHARAMRSGATPQGSSRHPVPATAAHLPAAQHATHQLDDTARQFMPSWKKLLFRN